MKKCLCYELHLYHFCAGLQSVSLQSSLNLTRDWSFAWCMHALTEVWRMHIIVHSFKSPSLFFCFVFFYYVKWIHCCNLSVHASLFIVIGSSCGYQWTPTTNPVLNLTINSTSLLNPKPNHIAPPTTVNPNSNHKPFTTYVSNFSYKPHTFAQDTPNQSLLKFWFWYPKSEHMVKDNTPLLPRDVLTPTFPLLETVFNLSGLNLPRRNDI